MVVNKHNIYDGFTQQTLSGDDQQIEASSTFANVQPNQD